MIFPGIDVWAIMAEILHWHVVPAIVALVIILAIIVPMAYYEFIKDEVKYFINFRRILKEKPAKKRIRSDKFFPFQTFRRYK